MTTAHPPQAAGEVKPRVAFGHWTLESDDPEILALAAALHNQQAARRVADELTAEHFRAPLHRRLLRLISSSLARYGSAALDVVMAAARDEGEPLPPDLEPRTALLDEAPRFVGLAIETLKARRRRRGKSAEAEAAPPPPELEGRHIHPALYFKDGFASVGILEPGPEGLAWRIITSNRGDYPAEALGPALAVDPAPYPGLGERWPADMRAAYVAGEAPRPSWASAVATALAVFRDYVEATEDGHYAVCALWTVSTYLHQVFPAFPRLNLHGERGSGKSKTLKLTALMAFNGLLREAPRPAPLFRLVETLRPTFCLDEMDHLDREDRGDMLAILCAGYQQGGAVDRCDPQTFQVRPFAVYAPIAFGGIKGLHRTLADRCITIVMQPGTDRRRINRAVDAQNPDPRILAVRDLGHRLALSRWPEVRAAWDRLALPPWLNGRSRELWAPLWTLADLIAAEAPALDLRPALRALARPDAEERAEMGELAEAILTALENRLGGVEAITIQPGALAAEVKGSMGYDVTPQGIGLRFKALGFTPDPGRKGGTRYTVKAENIRAIRGRRTLAEDEDGAHPPAD